MSMASRVSPMPASVKASTTDGRSLGWWKPRVVRDDTLAVKASRSGRAPRPQYMAV